MSIHKEWVRKRYFYKNCREELQNWICYNVIQSCLWLTDVRGNKNLCTTGHFLLKAKKTSWIFRARNIQVYSHIGPIWHELFWASKAQGKGEGGGGLFGSPIVTFVLERQWCSNLVCSFTNLSRVNEIIQNYELNQVSWLMTS